MSYCPTFSSTFNIVRLSKFCYSGECVTVSHCGLIFQYLDLLSNFSYVYLPQKFSIWNAYSYFAHISSWAVFFLVCRSSLYIFWKQILWQFNVLKIYHLAFHSFYVSFYEHKFSILTWPNLPIFLFNSNLRDLFLSWIDVFLFASYI